MRTRAAFLFFRISTIATIALALAGSGVGCATLLGFDDTTLRSDDGGPTDDGMIPESDGDLDGHTLADGAQSRLTTSPASLELRRGGQVTVTVNLERAADVAGAVTIELTGLPTGVTATTAMLGADASSGTMTLSATNTATLGSANLSLVAEGTSLPASPIPLLVAGAPGALDTTFDVDGLVFDSSKGVGSTYFALALQSDDKPIAGGAGGPMGGPVAGWIIRRFLDTGATDPAFTATGLPVDGQLNALGVDSKGNVVCLGTSTPATATPAQLTLLRLSSTGVLDATFGIVRLPALEAPAGSTGLGLAIGSDDSIVVVGSRGTDGIIARFTSGGVRDATFNAGATVALPSTTLVGVNIDASGAIYAGGLDATGPSYLLTRRTTTGAADATFGTAGILDFGMGYRANGFARMPTGDLVLVGDTAAGAYTAGATKSTGVMDFARMLSAAPGAGFYGVAAQDSDLFVAAGHTSVANGEARVERIHLNGVQDTTFGTQGITLLDDPDAGNAFTVQLYAAAVPTNGRILVAGNRSNVGASVFRLWQ